MTLDASARIQSNSGTVTTATTTLAATLPNPTAAGSTLLAWIAVQGFALNFPAADPPWYRDAVQSGNVYAWRRDNQPAGETSWSFTSAGSIKWAWRIEEWSGLSTVNQPDAMTGNGQNVVTGTAGTQNNDSAKSPSFLCTPDVTDYAALAVFRAGSAGTSADLFPAGRSYSSGFSEVDVLTVGTGTTSNDFQLIIAEGYPGATGNIDCVLTWDTTGGGTYADKAVNAWMACYQPDVPAPPGGILTS